jgi:hypothetical protein
MPSPSKEDDCGFNGDGTSTYGGIRGVTQLLIDNSHNAGKVAATTGHPTFAEIDATDIGTSWANCRNTRCRGRNSIARNSRLPPCSSGWWPPPAATRPRR